MEHVFSVYFQGADADCMYFIEEGEVKITVKNKVTIVFLRVLLIMSHLMRLCYFLSSVNSFFKRACAAIQWG